MRSISIFLTALLTTSAAMSAVILLVFLLTNVIANRIRASHRYYLWLIVLFGLLLPFRPIIPVPFDPVEITVFQTSETQGTIIEHTQNEDPANELQKNPLFESSVISEPAFIDIPTEKSAISYTIIIFGIWAIGALGILAFHLRSYAIFSSSVRRWGSDVKDERVLSILQYVMTDMGLKDRDIQIKTCIFTSSPMIIGFRNPTILLPEKEISPDELEHIFKHELTHYKHRDLWINLLILLVSAMHWFNPVVHIMVKMIRADCEAACDEAVIAGSDADKRKHYGETIIGFIGVRAGITPVLSTYFYGGSKNMKKRLSSIMDSSRKGIGLAAVCGIFISIATLMSGTVFAASATNDINRYIGEAAAKAIALEHAGILESQVTFIKAHLDYEDGRTVYDIEFYSGNTEYDYEIDAVNGGILEYDRDTKYRTIQNNSTGRKGTSRQFSEQKTPINTEQYIGEEKAKSIALTHAGILESQTSRMKVKLDREDGAIVYEVEFNYGRIEYEYEIDAVSGTILKIDVDYDD